MQKWVHYVDRNPQPGAAQMSEKKTIDVTFELDDNITFSSALSDLEDITGLRIVHAEFHAPDDEDECDG